MTDRSTFPDGVPVHDVDLQNESTQVSTQLRRRLMDHAQPGLVSGGVISLNGTTPSRIDVTALVAYASGGEMIEIGTQTSLAMADYTLGAVNYVVAVYTETQGTPQAHQTDGTTRNTRATRSGRLVVMSQAQYSAMPSTSTDLSVDAVDRAAPIGIVLANGFTGATPNSLIAGDVIQDTAWSSFAFPDYQGTQLSGVNIASIDQATVAGSGSLAFTAAGTTATWSAPGGGTAGVAVNIGAGGQFTLTSGTIARTITINVIAELLPLVNATASIVVTIGYTPSFGPRFSLRDMAHRSTFGSVAPTYTNPHGLAPTDWGAVAIDIPMQVRLGEDFLNTDLAASYPRLTERMRSGVRTLFNQHQINRTNNIWAREYAAPIANGEHWTTVNARWNQASSQWVPDYSSANSFAYVIGDGRVQMLYAATAGAAFANSAWIIAAEWSPGSYALNLGSGMLTGTSDSQRPRIDIDYRDSSTDRTRVLRSASSASSTVGGVNVYRVSSSTQGGDYAIEICANAEYSNASSQFHQMDAARASTRLAISPTGMTLYGKAAGSADWGPSSWTPALLSVTAAGVVTAGSDFAYTTPPTHTKRIPGMAAHQVASTGSSTASFRANMTESTAPGGTGGGYARLACAAAENCAAIWPVELPDGATVTGAAVSFFATSLGTGTGHGWMLYRQARDSETLATTRAAGILALSTGAGAHTDSFTPDQNNVIDNANYSYFVYMVISSSGGAGPIASVYSIQLTYTMTTLRGA